MSIILEVEKINSVTQPTRMMTTQEKLDLAFNKCVKVYGSSTDGSFESCLISEGYYKMLRAERDSHARDVSSGQEINQTFNQSL